ncbi:MAG: SIMPL domain-containing protein [Deltaproteobacteria bacterium]|nr:SIMPL domain-containing protein [Deltaproteobacteria bacterium]
MGLRNSVRDGKGWRSVATGMSGIAGVLALAGPLLLAPPARADATPDPRNRASFQVVVTREVQNDWATARLSATAEGKEPAQVASEVNGRIERALARAKKEKGIEVESGGYTTQPVYDANRIVRWQAWQEIRLASADVDRLSKLIGVLQEEQLLLSGIEFSVKRETREALQDELTLEALRKFRARADLVTKGMAGGGWSLIALSVGQGGGQPYYRAMRAEADMAMKTAAAPAFEAGKSELSVTVDGTIELD